MVKEKKVSQNNKRFNIATTILIGLILVIGLYRISLNNFLLFHSLAEIFSIVIAVGIFIIAWNTRKFSNSNFLLFLGIAILFIGFLDLIHTLAYKGMGIFLDYDANLPTQLWVAARYLQAITFLVAIFFINRKSKPRWVILVYTVIVIVLMLMLFYWHNFPNSFIEGQGLTPFKKISEYIISGILLIFMILLYFRKQYFSKKVFNWLIIAGISTIISEIAFTFYISVFGLSNMIGHFFKIIAFYSLYVAIIQTTLLKPYETLFADLQRRSQEAEKINIKLRSEITKRKEIQREIKESEKKYRELFESSTEGIIFTDMQGKIIDVNQAYIDMLGYSKERTIKLTYQQITPKKWHKMEAEIVKNQILKRGYSDEYQKEYIRKDKTVFPISIRVWLKKDKNGKPIGMWGIVRDVTKEQEIDKVKSEFVSLASHQLRTPLTAVNWYTEMLLSGDIGKFQPEQKKYLKEIYNGNNNMIDLVKALLNVSRIELGTLAIEPESTNLKKLSDSVLEEFKLIIKKNKLKIEKDYTKELSDINIDPKLMRIVFQNLISNAIKYTPLGGQINIGITKQKSDILISVKDTGYGIPKDQQSKIFTKLFRADNIVEKETEGTGLGLYIIKYVVEQFKGKIWFESRENKGTTFYVTIPSRGIKKKNGTKGLVYSS